jgi:hypothetical protein
MNSNADEPQHDISVYTPAGPRLWLVCAHNITPLVNSCRSLDCRVTVCKWRQ